MNPMVPPRRRRRRRERRERQAPRRDADDPRAEGFVASLIRDSTITGLPGDTGAPPVEPHAPQAQQERDKPVGSEPPAGDNL